METLTTPTVQGVTFPTWEEAQTVARRFGNAWPSVVTMADGIRRFRVIVMSRGVARILCEEATR